MVDEYTHEGHRCLLAPRWHPCEPQGPVILQAVPRGVEGVPRPVLRDLDRDVVQVACSVGVVGDERGDVLRRPPEGAIEKGDFEVVAVREMCFDGVGVVEKGV